MNAELTNSDIAEATIGPRSRVATSPDELKGCKWELEADTEKFIETIEVFLVTSQKREYLLIVLDSENCLQLCLGRVQCVNSASEFSVWWHGESNFHVRNP